MSKLNHKNLISLAQDFLDEQPYKLVMNNKELYQYNGKFYEMIDDFKLGQMVQNFFIVNDAASHYRTHLSSNLIQTIKFSPNILNVPEFDCYFDLINLTNGVFNFETNELSKHSPDLFFTSIVNVEYNLKATPDQCPNFLKFLKTTFCHYDQEEKTFSPDYETIDNIFRLGGYLLYPQCKMEKLFMFLGEGANGKSLLVNIFRSFFDPKFVTELSLNQLSKEDKFARAQLMYSRLNIAGEEKGQALDAEQIKKIASGQFISIDRKFKESLSLKPRAKLIIDSNDRPYFKDNSYGTYRRLYILAFENRFVSEAEYKKMEDPIRHRIFKRRNHDEFLEEILKEKSAIFNLFLDGLKQLKEMDWNLPESQKTQEVFEEYKKSTDTLGTWLLDNWEVDNLADKYFHLFHIYQEYREYYKDNYGFEVKASSKLVGQRIRDVFRIDFKKVNITKKNPDGTTSPSSATVYYLKRKVDPDMQKYETAGLI